ncbi:hypothetical protein CYMTET_41834 [Cymbomonas tetramitiformis]|uniref:Uncharacterized protein n=1 Tax=Cymbomonas tetramitiformis TaxID=36881 RepID=A0AAE0F241_9CHLO|nr:hypothetical protein CYMTET_41834 [Cymbomonas tetramitiformis]
MEVVKVLVEAAEEGEKHGKEAVSGENVAETQQDKQRPPSPDYDQFQAWLEGENDMVGGKKKKEDTARPERSMEDLVDVRTFFKPAESAEKNKEEAKLEEEAKQAADDHEAAKKTVKKLNKVIKNYVTENLQEMDLQDETGAAVRAEFKRKKDELEVLTTERKKKKERRQTLEATCKEASSKGTA